MPSYAGDVWDEGAEDQGQWFGVWSSSRNSNTWNAWNMNGNSSEYNLNNNNRYNGLSVRGVLGAPVFIFFSFLDNAYNKKTAFT